MNHDMRARLALPSLAFVLGLGACNSPAEPAPAAATKADAKAGSADEKADAKVDQKAERTPPKRNVEQIPAPADVAAPAADAEKMDSGVACKTVTPGDGEPPTENDTVKIHYTAWSAEGETVDTTTTRKAPKLVRMAKPPIPGWGDALKTMKPGGKSLCWVPENQAYMGRKGAPAGQITYEIQLEEVLRAPETPEDVAAPPKDAKTTKSGLAYKVLTEGTGDDKHPRKWDRVRVHYSGWTTDGKMFDSSVTRAGPSSFTLDKVVPGWTEGVQLMAVGDKYRFWVPEDLAYKGQPGKPQGMLVFDIELISFDELPEPPPPPETPKDVAAPPKDAKKTDSGLAYEVLTKGTGTEHPSETSTVTVHYAGWTTDGKMFDSSIPRGKPSTFPLNRVIPGWTEGLQLMVIGEKTRFWIPEELAYKGKPGRPQGMLVFDVELLEIK